MNKLEHASYTAIFPENLKKYKNLTAFSKNIENTFKTYIVSKIQNLALFYNLEIQEDKVLDEIAWFFNIDKYRTDLDREIKIKLIKSAYWVHSKKGTKTAVISQLKNLNYEIKIEEWFEYGGRPFTFRLITGNESKDKNWLKNVLSLIEEYKNVRSILEAFYSLKEKKYNYYVAGYKEVFITAKKVNAAEDREINKNIFLGAYKQIRKEIIK
ncbi:phage tail protein I [Fusobacterium hwasookii]|uniref:Phage tail protein n=1 Tax=Fusobacterium hwasookii ChDC F206 TaxID=1307443 RepID=A0AAC8WLY0_9FUSO|nr:phage tail protein I [Fusobacterium hwasookii]ALQ36137.1 phage tail protein [Fusobacterium hwasookii ChDC F206]ALQ37226.1 phage tail protein [Fusobacterium hwasookii ChDC F300]